MYSATGSAVAVQYSNACTTIVVLYNITGSVVQYSNVVLYSATGSAVQYSNVCTTLVIVYNTTGSAVG